MAAKIKRTKSKNLSLRAKSSRQTIARAAVKTAKKVGSKTSQARNISKSDEKPLITQIPSFKNDIKNPKVFIPIVLVILAILIFVFRSLFIAAIVNGQPITRMALDSNLEKKYGKQELTSFITQDLIMQEAANKNIAISDSEVSASIKQISDSLSKQGQSLDSALAMRGMTKQDFIQQLKIQKIVEKVLGDQLKVTDQEIQDYMDKNKDSLPTGLSDTELKAQVKQQLQQQKLSEKAQAWIADLQKKAKINYFINF